MSAARSPSSVALRPVPLKTEGAPPRNQFSVPGCHPGAERKRLGPVPKSPLISAQMSRMPVVGTGPEMALRRILHHRGLRFRIAPKQLPGKPDIAFTRARIAVFVYGCFWHACELHGTLPKNNREWWQTKFAANRERDRRKDRELEAVGWVPVHVWEHDRATEAADAIELLWKERVARS